MNRSIFAVASFALSLSALPASADPFLFTATTQFPTVVSSFTINFDDTGDGKLDFGEVTAFSGVNFVFADILLTILAGIPDIPGFADCGGSSSPDCVDWEFSNPSTAFGLAAIENWTYQITTVPEPGTLGLLGLGLGWFMLLRRRKQFDTHITRLDPPSSSAASLLGIGLAGLCFSRRKR